MECRIRCHVKQGQFNDEMIVRIVTVDERGDDSEAICLAYGDSVVPETAPDATKEVPATLRAHSIGRKDDLVAVVLPQSTFQNGPSVIVHDSQLVS